MYPSRHLIFGIFFSLIFFYFFPQIGVIGFFLIIASTFFVDADHYLFYVVQKKDFRLKNAYKWFVEQMKKRLSLPKSERTKYKYEILICHGVEFWIVLALLSFFHVYFFYLFVGVIFHMFLDLLALTYYEFPLYVKLSQLYNFAKDRDKKELL